MAMDKPENNSLADKEKEFLLDCLYKTDWTYAEMVKSIIIKLNLIG